MFKKKTHPHKRIQLRMSAYGIVSDRLESALGFALNRLEDACGFDFTDELRQIAISPMMNELMMALEDVVDWERSG